MNLTDRFLTGEPIELTEASQEVYDLRNILQGDCYFEEQDIDVGGCVYWNDRRSVVVYVTENPQRAVF